MNLWLTVLGMGIVTYGIRLSLFVFVSHTALPSAARDALRFVLPAVLLAIILPAVLYVGEDQSFDLTLGNERLLAAAFAAAVAWLSRNVWLTVVTGMAVLWLLQWALQ
jgi:branched-subunit amino acid transport protein